MGLELIQPGVFRQKGGDVLRPAEGVQVGEHRVAGEAAGVGDPDVVGVGEHVHHLLPHFVGRIGQIDAVAQGFAHFGLAVDAGQAGADRAFGQQGGGLHQGVAVDGVELAHDLPGLLQHGQLVFAHGHGGGAEGGDIGRLADGIGEKAHRDAGLEIALLDLGLHRGVPLQAGHRDQVHIVKGEFRQLGNLGLDQQGGAGRVQAAGQVIQRHLDDVAAHLFRVVGVIGEGLGVGDHDEDLIEGAGVLQLHPAPQRTHIVAHVQPPGGPVAGEDDFFHCNQILSHPRANGPGLPDRLGGGIIEIGYT